MCALHILIKFSKIVYYSGIMPDAFGHLLCFKLCRHNRPGPIQKSAEVSILLNSQSPTMPSNRITAGNKRTRATNAATPTPKRKKKLPNKRPRPLTTDDILVLVREVCKNLLLHQTEDEAAIQGRLAEEGQTTN